MKVINKILCFLSVLVLFVPLLCFNVSAHDISEFTLEEYYLTGGTGDWSGIIRDDITSSTVSLDYPYQLLITYNNKYCGYDISDSSSRFKLSIARLYLYHDDFNNSRDFYYIYRSGLTNQGGSYFHCLLSLSPIFISNDKFSSESEIYYSYFVFSNPPGSEFSISSKSYFGSSWDLVAYLQGNSLKSTDSTVFLDVNAPCASNSNVTFDTVSEVYSNCITEYNGNKVSERPKSSALKDNIEVNLTPTFGFDMDRVFDNITGQNDYFKFEITNNSDQSIQWCSYIVDSDYEDDENGINDSEDIRYLVPSYEYCKWLYITDEIYYSSSVKTVEKYLGLKTETTLTSNKKTGAFYFHLLEPGESYSDYIYWENVNIQPIKSYDIRFNCLPVDDLAFPSDMFSSRYFVDTLGSVLGSDFEKEDGFDDYVIDDTLYTEVYRCSFSVLDMPDFTLSVKGGNSIANGGFSDAETLKNNFETSTDLSDGRIHANSNYIENPLLLNGSDVNVDFDNVTIDNVKSYITYSQDFFSLIKSVLCTFPAFIWVLICFGLTGLIVIAIVKALL